MINNWKNDYVAKPLPTKALLTGFVILALGLLMMALAFAIDHQRAAFNGIITMMFLLSVALGSLFIIALEYLVSADWSVPFRRVAEILSVVIFAVPIFAIPLFFNMHDLFHWTHLEDVLNDPILKSKMAYLNEEFFSIRTIVTFLILFLFWYLLAGRSFKQDYAPKANFIKITTKFAAIFMPIFAITLTVMAVDWMMSLEPHWFSTIFGVYYFAGSFTTALAVITLIVILLNENNYMGKMINRDHYYNFGGLLFAFTNFWAYIAFSQFLLIWYANIPEETSWFLHRSEGSWMFVSILMVVVHFVVPYILLLSQPSKSDPKRLKVAAIWLILVHFYDLYWLIMPTYGKHGAPFSWMEFYPLVVSVGVVMVVFLLFARNKNLLPIGDPKLPKGLHFHL